MTRTAFVDEQLLARGFNTDDVVRKSGNRDFVMSPYIGRVLYSNVDTGTVQVQWPWGAEMEAPSTLVRDASGHYLPPEIDQSYSTWEGARNINSPEVVKADKKWRGSLAAFVVSEYERRTMPLYHAACEAWHCQMDEVETFIRMASIFGPKFGEDAIRLTISNLYETGRRFAIYWFDRKRKYKVTQKEKTSKTYACPRCRGILKPRVHTHGGKILLCKACGFTVAVSDLMDGTPQIQQDQQAPEETE